MPPTNKRYTIETIKDLINLHPDQLTRCFRDFQEAHLVARELSKIGIATMQQFTWIDDDKNTKILKSRAQMVISRLRLTLGRISKWKSLELNTELKSIEYSMAIR